MSPEAVSSFCTQEDALCVHHNARGVVAVMLPQGVRRGTAACLLHQGQRARWGPPGRPGICSAQAAALLARRVVLCASPLTCGSRRCNPSVKHSGPLCPQQPIVALYRSLCSVPGRPAHIGKPLETPWCYSCATAQSRLHLQTLSERIRSSSDLLAYLVTKQNSSTAAIFLCRSAKNHEVRNGHYKVPAHGKTICTMCTLLRTTPSRQVAMMQHKV